MTEAAITAETAKTVTVALVRVPLQKLVAKFFPEISPILLSRVMGI